MTDTEKELLTITVHVEEAIKEWKDRCLTDDGLARDLERYATAAARVIERRDRPVDPATDVESWWRAFFGREE